MGVPCLCIDSSAKFVNGRAMSSALLTAEMSPYPALSVEEAPDDNSMLLQFPSSEKVSPLMSKFPQPCSVCGTLTAGASRCPAHEREYQANRNRTRGPRAGDEARRARKSQLYNYAYRQEAKRIKENATHCHICRKPFVEGDRVEADHLIAGMIGSPLAPAHRECNQRRGDKPL